MISCGGSAVARLEAAARSERSAMPSSSSGFGTIERLLERRRADPAIGVEELFVAVERAARDRYRRSVSIASVISSGPKPRPMISPIEVCSSPEPPSVIW